MVPLAVVDVTFASKIDELGKYAKGLDEGRERRRTSVMPRAALVGIAVGKTVEGVTGAITAWGIAEEFCTGRGGGDDMAALEVRVVSAVEVMLLTPSGYIPADAVEIAGKERAAAGG